MDIETTYAVNLFFPNPRFLQIYFEAIANSFDAGATEISIKISSDAQIEPGHLEITLIDNGDGFTKDRFDRFKRVQRPQDQFHKGLGRLVFLHYFSDIDVISQYSNKIRNFSFSEVFNGESEVEHCENIQEKSTTLHFHGFIGKRLKSYNDIKPNHIKSQVIEQFLPLFFKKKVSNQHFKITIELDIIGKHKQKKITPDLLTITSNDIPEFKTLEIKEKSIHMYDPISISYSIREELGSNKHLTVVCIDDRTIPLELFTSNAIPHHHSAIFLFESTLFNGCTDSSRQKLNLPEDISEIALFKVLRKEVGTILNKELPAIEKKNRETRTVFEDRFPHLSGYFEEDTIGIIDKDEAIYSAQNKFFTDQKRILESNLLDDETFKKSLEISSRTLTEYILYRELIINRLSQLDQKDQETKIHDLIVPRYKEFDKGSLLDEIYNNNAWILDDKFMSYKTILSEARMKAVISAITLEEEVCEDAGRPDISMIFSADPYKREKVDVVVVEIKKKKVDDKEGPYAKTQLLKRARKLAEHCPNIQRVWYFAVIEIDDPLSQFLQDDGWTPLFSKGIVFYRDFHIKLNDTKSVLTPICLLSYDAIIKDARARNHTFLEILKSNLREKIKKQTKN